MSMMRVTGGVFRGRRIKSLPGQSTRPTSDMVRESLFNILGEKIADSSFLDIFAGTGSVGIEALSRGAERAAFIEKNGFACKIIRENLDLLGIADKCVVIKADFSKGLRMLENNGEAYDVIFIDPPYDRGYASDCLEAVTCSKLLKPGSVIVVQHSVSEDLQAPPGIICYKEKRYGITKLSFFTGVSRDVHSNIPREF